MRCNHLICTLSLVLILFVIFVVPNNKQLENFFEEYRVASTLEPDDFALFQGHGLPLENPVTGYHPMYDEKLPIVDPKPGSTKRSMYMFAFNECKPECCDTSPFSCDKGCVCLTPHQEKLLLSRGGNSHYSSKKCQKPE